MNDTDTCQKNAKNLMMDPPLKNAKRGKFQGHITKELQKKRTTPPKEYQKEQTEGLPTRECRKIKIVKCLLPK